MMLRQRKDCYDPKDLEGFCPFLTAVCIGDGGVVLGSDLRAEASADLEFGLRGSEGLLTVVVRRRDCRICQEGEDVDPVLGNALFDFVFVSGAFIFPGRIRIITVSAYLLEQHILHFHVCMHHPRQSEPTKMMASSHHSSGQSCPGVF